MTEEPGTPSAESPVGRAIAVLREPVALGEGPIERSLAEIGTNRRRGAMPLWIGTGLAAGLALALVGHRGHPRPDAPAGRSVTFVLQSPAQQVALIGDFNDWDRNATPLTNASGTWRTTVALKPGRYRYAFVLDGRRLEADPSAPVALDEFGASTSAITVGR